MQIEWNHFTPWTSLAGGVLIGVAAGALILINGRITGISGILDGLIERSQNDLDWHIAFLLGLVAAPHAWRLVAHLRKRGSTHRSRASCSRARSSGSAPGSAPVAPAAMASAG